MIAGIIYPLSNWFREVIAEAVAVIQWTYVSHPILNDSHWEPALVHYPIACRRRLQQFMLKGKTFIVWLSNQSGSLQTTEAWCDHRLSRYGKLIAAAQLTWLMFLCFDWQVLDTSACLSPIIHWLMQVKFNHFGKKLWTNEGYTLRSFFETPSKTLIYWAFFLFLCELQGI